MLSTNLSHRAPRPLGLPPRPEESIWYLWPGQVIDVQELDELDLAVHHIATTRIWGRPIAALPMLQPSGRVRFQGWYSRSALPSRVLAQRASGRIAPEYTSLRIVGLENEYWDGHDEPLIYAARLAICGICSQPGRNERYVCVECDISEGRTASGVDKVIMASYRVPRASEQSIHLSQSRLLGSMALVGNAELIS